MIQDAIPIHDVVPRRRSGDLDRRELEPTEGVVSDRVLLDEDGERGLEDGLEVVRPQPDAVIADPCGIVEDVLDDEVALRGDVGDVVGGGIPRPRLPRIQDDMSPAGAAWIIPDVGELVPGNDAVVAARHMDAVLLRRLREIGGVPVDVNADDQGIRDAAHTNDRLGAVA